MSLTAYPTLRLRLTPTPALKMRFLPAIPGFNAEQAGNKVNRSGDTMTGPLILNGDPTAALGAATKQYVDAAGGGGNVSTSGAITINQLAQWASATTIKSLPLGATMTLAGGELNTTAGGGNVMAVNSPAVGQLARWTSGVQIEGIAGTQGSVLYRDATQWTVLAPGTSGQVLTTNGVGANPAWTAAGGTAIGYSDGMMNGALSVSAAAGVLTIALKTAAGVDPSAADPVDVIFRNVSATIGNYTKLSITAAASLVVSSGSTLGTSSATAFRLWIVGFNDGGTFRLGIINCAITSTIYPLMEGIASSVAEGGAGAADSAGIIYTGTAVTSKAMRILGYAEWSASGLVAGTWTTTNLIAVQLFGPGIHKPGDVIQVVSFVAGTGTSTTSTTFIVTVITANIIPTSAANRIDAEAVGMSSLGTATYGLTEFRRDGVTILSNTNFGNAASSNTSCSWLAFDWPNKTTSTNYAVYLRSNDGVSVTCPAGLALLKIREFMT